MKRRIRRFKCKKSILFIVGLITSCLLVPEASGMALKQRGYDAVGGEVLIPFLYVVLIAFIKSFTDIKKENAHK